MRDLKRSIARHLMEMHGVEKINKKQYLPRVEDNGQKLQDSAKKVSFFSMHWKEYLDPSSEYRKDLEKKLTRNAARQSKLTGKTVRAAWPVSRW